jgi:uncharacterized SAM-binding protein YcdF (DUF218 family)
MLFFLRKLIEALLLPIGISGLLTVAGVISRRRWIAVAGVVMLYAFSTRFTGDMMMWPLERVYEPKAVSTSPNADAIVVLSGDVVRGITAPGVQWGEGANRYFAGLDLAQAGKANLLVLSSGAILSQSAVLRQTAISHGIQPERIIVIRSVRTTDEEARAVSKMPHIHSILLVTSAFHMPRAVLLFRSRGLDVVPFPTDERVLGRQHLSLVEFIPNSSELRDSDRAMQEYYALAVYHIILPFRR